MYDDVLIPTDGSDAAMAAVEQGVSVAEQFEATAHFLHVVDVGIEMSASGVGTIADDLTETLSQEAEQALDEAISQAAETGIAYEREILEGEPHNAIAHYSTDNDVDLIVMGASGQSGLKERLLGSTADRVLRTVDVSVLLARP